MFITKCCGDKSRVRFIKSSAVNPFCYFFISLKSKAYDLKHLHKLLAFIII